MNLKLFLVEYMDDFDNHETYLTVGISQEEVQKREEERLSNECSCFMSCFVYEITEIDGHKIIVE